MSQGLNRGGVEASERHNEWMEAWLSTDWANEPRLKRGGGEASERQDEWTEAWFG